MPLLSAEANPNSGPWRESMLRAARDPRVTGPSLARTAQHRGRTSSGDAKPWAPWMNDRRRVRGSRALECFFQGW